MRTFVRFVAAIIGALLAAWKLLEAGLNAVGLIETARGTLDPNGIVAKVLFWPQLGLVATVSGLILLVLIWRQGQNSRHAKPSIHVAPACGTARWNGRTLPSADITLSNSGDPFNLVAKAALLTVAPDFTWSRTDRWEYQKRPVMGGDGSSFFHIATLDRTPSSARPWAVAVQSEGMLSIRNWEGPKPLWFEIEWKFYSEVDARLTLLKTTRLRVTLSADGTRFSVLDLDTGATASTNVVSNAAPPDGTDGLKSSDDETGLWEQLNALEAYGTKTLLGAFFDGRHPWEDPDKFLISVRTWRRELIDVLQKLGADASAMSRCRSLPITHDFEVTKAGLWLIDDLRRFKEAREGITVQGGKWQDEYADRLAVIESARPVAAAWCECNSGGAYLYVRNDGGGALFYATLKVTGGPTHGLDGSEFVAWTHTNETKTTIPRGVTFKAKLAGLEWHGGGSCQWKLFGRSVNGPTTDARAMYSSMATSTPICRAPTLTVSGLVMAEPDLSSGPIPYRIELSAFGCMDNQDDTRPTDSSSNR